MRRSGASARTARGFDLGEVGGRFSGERAYERRVVPAQLRSQFIVGLGTPPDRVPAERGASTAIARTSSLSAGSRRWWSPVRGTAWAGELLCPSLGFMFSVNEGDGMLSFSVNARPLFICARNRWGGGRQA